MSSEDNGSSSVDNAQGVVQVDDCKITEVSLTLQACQNIIDAADVS